MSNASQGESIVLSVQFYDPTTGVPTDPTSLQFQILFESATAPATPSIVVGPLMFGGLVRTGVGAYQYIWSIPTTIPIGDYQAQWIAVVNGIPQFNFEDFLVTAPPQSTTDMSAELSQDPNIQVGIGQIKVRFGFTPRVVSIYKGTYILSRVEGSTTSTVPNAFLPIQPGDYNTISRRLTLHFNAELVPNAQYMLEVSNLLNAAGIEVPAQQYLFSLSPLMEIDTDPINQPIYVEDHSVLEDAYSSLDTIAEINPNFYVMSTDPDLNQVFVDPAYKNGRITINFSIAPLGNYVNSENFVLQYKPLSRGFNTWTTVPGVIVSVDSQHATVFLDVPSLDATPVYGQPGTMYYNTDCRYRVKISSSVGATAPPQ